MKETKSFYTALSFKIINENSQNWDLLVDQTITSVNLSNLGTTNLISFSFQKRGKILFKIFSLWPLIVAVIDKGKTPSGGPWNYVKFMAGEIRDARLVHSWQLYIIVPCYFTLTVRLTVDYNEDSYNCWKITGLRVGKKGVNMRNCGK